MVVSLVLPMFCVIGGWWVLLIRRLMMRICVFSINLILLVLIILRTVGIR